MAEEAQGFRKRMPSVHRSVSDIRPEDMRVSVVGTVLDRADDGLMLDDGTGKVDVTLDEPPPVERGKLARVFGRVVPVEGGVQLQGELVQDMTGLDMELMNRVRKLESR